MPAWITPAALTRMSSRPKRLTASSTTLDAKLSSDTSPASATPRPPADWIFSMVAYEPIGSPRHCEHCGARRAERDRSRLTDAGRSSRYQRDAACKGLPWRRLPFSREKSRWDCRPRASPGVMVRRGLRLILRIGRNKPSP